MNPKQPVTRHRPTRVSDGQNGWRDVFPNAGLTLYGMFRVHNNETTLTVDRFDDVRVSDYVALNEDGEAEAFYRVNARVVASGGSRAALTLERTERPISPVRYRLVSASGNPLVSAAGNYLTAE